MSPMTDVNAVIADAVSNSPDLRARAEQFVSRLLDEAEELLDRSNPTMRVQILRSWLPTLIREMNKTNVNDELGELRTALSDLRRKVLDGDKPHTAD